MCTKVAQSPILFIFTISLNLNIGDLFIFELYRLFIFISETHFKARAASILLVDFLTTHMVNKFTYNKLHYRALRLLCIIIVCFNCTNILLLQRIAIEPIRNGKNHPSSHVYGLTDFNMALYFIIKCQQ